MVASLHAISRYTFDFSNDMKIALRKVATTVQARRRALRVSASNAPSTSPAIYFLTPDYPKPAGGIRVIYRLVDILNAAGVNALVLHQKPHFWCTWFENRTRVGDVSNVTVRQGDLLVVSELDVAVLAALPKGVRYAIFNQNAHMTWQRGPSSAWYAATPDLAGVITVSDHNLEMLRYAYPGCRLERIHLGIDTDLFYPGGASRSRRIAYMPRRGQDDATQVLEILRARGVLDGWEIAALDGLSHRQVAEELRRSRIFLAFTHQEGFGLPAAEAMACGCYVIGNHGFGGREFFQAEICSPVQVGDVLHFAQSVERIIAIENKTDGWCAQKGELASKAIAEVYSQARERDDVLRLFRNFTQANVGASK
ncbi:glycosyltransferase family 4 protein [Rhizobium mesoamericanum]|uniref:glycosyltransferase family 4 protein n=1 Tax=Rhizobium mesoamericanum TaxID=1079800 RepID=UPI0004290A95|nr:glycosyltransferase family 4 protein [Rhizobium mesoamericanum]